MLFRSNNYSQVGIVNKSTGTNASADLALYNNIDPIGQLAGFVDLGINSTNRIYDGIYPGSAGDAYLFTDSHHLILGTTTGSNARVTIFAGGVSESENAKLILFGNNQHQISGSLLMSGSLTINSSLIDNQITNSIASGTKVVSINPTGSYTSAFYNYTSATKTIAGQLNSFAGYQGGGYGSDTAGSGGGSLHGSGGGGMTTGGVASSASYGGNNGGGGAGKYFPGFSLDRSQAGGGGGGKGGAGGSATVGVYSVYCPY